MYFVYILFQINFTKMSILGASISTVLELIDYCIRQKYKSRKAQLKATP